MFSLIDIDVEGIPEWFLYLLIKTTEFILLKEIYKWYNYVEECRECIWT